MLKGDLADFTMPDILRLLAFTSKTGRLLLHGGGSRGRVVVADGLVRDASADAERLPLARRLIGRAMVDGATLRELLSDRDSLLTDLELARELLDRDLVDTDELTMVLREQTVDAVFDLLRWPGGTFEFDTRPGAAVAAPALALGVDDLLAEAEARLERWVTISERTGRGDAVVTVGRPDSGAVQIDADGWQLLGLADGRRTIDDLAALSGRGQFDTRETLVGLLDLGVIAVGDVGGAGSLERLLADHRVLAELEPTAVRPTEDDARSTLLGATDADVDAVVPQAAELDGELLDPTSPAERIVEPGAAAVDAASSAMSTVGGTTPLAPPTDAPDVYTPEPADPAEAAPDVYTPEPAGPAEAVPAPAITPLRQRGRLRTDPTIDAELVGRLLDGVEGL